MEKFNVFLDNHPIGEVTVHSEGLYFRFECKCSLPDRQIYRLWITCGNSLLDLGILAPEGNQFSLIKRLPKKKLESISFHFAAVPNQKHISNEVVAVDSQERFPYLERLENAKLEYDSQMPYIRFLH